MKLKKITSKYFGQKISILAFTKSHNEVPAFYWTIYPDVKRRLWTNDQAVGLKKPDI